MNQRHFFYCVGVVAGVPDASGAGSTACPEHVLVGKVSLSKYSVIFGHVSVAYFPVLLQTVFRTTVSGTAKSTDL